MRGFSMLWININIDLRSGPLNVEPKPNQEADMWIIQENKGKDGKTGKSVRECVSQLNTIWINSLKAQVPLTQLCEKHFQTNLKNRK